jgi:hypothetical protein
MKTAGLNELERAERDGVRGDLRLAKRQSSGVSCCSALEEELDQTLIMSLA